MIKTELIIAVEDVAKSSEWYQQLLNCKSAHGGNVFEILTDKNGIQVLSLHKWGEHEHPTLAESKKENGNGLIIYFLVDDLNQIWENAKKMNSLIEEEPHLNPNSRRMEFSLRDLDNYYISITSESA